MLTEHRVITQEERKELQPVLEKISVQDGADILRFIDTNLDKIYDVYLIKTQRGMRILKLLGERRFDKTKYDIYFAGKGFAVPEIFEIFSAEGKDYVLMQCIEGKDARNCNPQDARKTGEELARIQSYYLTDGGHTETAEYYWNRYLEKYYEKLKAIFTDIDDVWEASKQRFFEAPQTLVHDDLLPINVLIGESQPWMIDWEIAGIYPYFLDLARFAYVYCSIDEAFFISNESANAFIDAYYVEMKTNPMFHIEKEQFIYDVAISAFYQYIMFQEYEKPLDEIKDTVDFKFLKEIIQVLREKREKYE
ncbi:MAG: aminoglycoside phosphotransferase family protein [Agathobacter sp.]|nr:aminoglycoside phosphotransferase family protein [Agathobacter sp.]